MAAFFLLMPQSLKRTSLSRLPARNLSHNFCRSTDASRLCLASDITRFRNYGNPLLHLHGLLHLLRRYKLQVCYIMLRGQMHENFGFYINNGSYHGVRDSPTRTWTAFRSGGFGKRNRHGGLSICRSASPEDGP